MTEQLLNQHTGSGGRVPAEWKPVFATMTLRGASGTRYAFAVYLGVEGLPHVGAVYCLSKRLVHGNGICQVRPVYAGQAADLGERMKTHARDGRLRRHRVNAVCVYLEANEFVRQGIVRDLVRELRLYSHGGR